MKQRTHTHTASSRHSTGTAHTFRSTKRANPRVRHLRKYGIHDGTCSHAVSHDDRHSTQTYRTRTVCWVEFCGSTQSSAVAGVNRNPRHSQPPTVGVLYACCNCPQDWHDPAHTELQPQPGYVPLPSSSQACLKGLPCSRNQCSTVWTRLLRHTTYISSCSRSICSVCCTARNFISCGALM